MNFAKSLNMGSEEEKKRMSANVRAQLEAIIPGFGQYVDETIGGYNLAGVSDLDLNRMAVRFLDDTMKKGVKSARYGTNMRQFSEVSDSGVIMVEQTKFVAFDPAVICQNAIAKFGNKGVIQIIACFLNGGVNLDGNSDRKKAFAAQKVNVLIDENGAQVKTATEKSFNEIMNNSEIYDFYASGMAAKQSRKREALSIARITIAFAPLVVIMSIRLGLFVGNDQFHLGIFPCFSSTYVQSAVFGVLMEGFKMLFAVEFAHAMHKFNTNFPDTPNYQLMLMSNQSFNLENLKPNNFDYLMFVSFAEFYMAAIMTTKFGTTMWARVNGVWNGAPSVQEMNHLSISCANPSNTKKNAKLVQNGTFTQIFDLNTLTGIGTHQANLETYMQTKFTGWTFVWGANDIKDWFAAVDQARMALGYIIRNNEEFGKYLDEKARKAARMSMNVSKDFILFFRECGVDMSKFNYYNEKQKKFVPAPSLGEVESEVKTELDENALTVAKINEKEKELKKLAEELKAVKVNGDSGRDLVNELQDLQEVEFNYQVDNTGSMGGIGNPNIKQPGSQKTTKADA